MPLTRQIEFLPRQASIARATLFSAPQPSHETLIAEVSTSANGELFCHRRQTDQLMVLRHGPSDPRDYQPRPIPAAFIAAWAALLPTCALTAP
jgi:hypothetical protein